MNVLVKSTDLQLKYFLSSTYLLKKKNLLSRFLLSKKSYISNQLLHLRLFFFKKFTGRLLNVFKVLLNLLFNTYTEVSTSLNIQKNSGFDISVTVGNLPSTPHPMSITINKLICFFEKMGFTFEFGSEVETESNCFSLLNMEPEHVARSPKNSFYLQNKPSHLQQKSTLLLRTQTSTVQIKTMLLYKPPLRKISFGRVFRNDNVDLTHNVSFYQLEGLYIDDFRSVNLSELKYILVELLKDLFKGVVKFKFRNSFFPFTTPSFEIDIFDIKSNTWIEVLGCGLVHPKVIQGGGLNQLSGYAFGIGIERLTMLLYPEIGLRDMYNSNYRPYVI